MATNERVGDMTMGELRAIIANILDEKLREKDLGIWPGQRRDRPVAEVLESMRKNLIEPAPDAPSSLELLQEDRDQGNDHP